MKTDKFAGVFGISCYGLLGVRIEVEIPARPHSTRNVASVATENACVF